MAPGEAAGDLPHWRSRRWNGRVHEGSTSRDANDVPWREGEDALWVHGCELTITNATDSPLRSRHALATKHPVDRTRVEAVVQAGRARGNIETEHTNTLNTNGAHLAHHDGHGQQHLSAVFLTLHLFAVLFHTVLGWVDPKDHRVRQALAARQPFFQDLQAFTRDLLCESWDQWLGFMLQGLEIAMPLDAS